MRSKVARRSGVLVHPTSFPGDWGIGDLGAAAREFLDFLGKTHQKIWQVLPLGPTGDDGSPYASYSANAGNPLLISIEDLVADGVEISVTPPGNTVSIAQDLHTVKEAKFAALALAAKAFRGNDNLVAAYTIFCAEQAEWLDDYALFMALKDGHSHKAWNQWPPHLAQRDPSALNHARAQLTEAVDFYKFTQFAFFRQWGVLRRYAHDRGIEIVGDIPFYVAFDSVDVWANPANFELMPETREPALMGGVPPDYFSETGQLWGNPVYNWAHLESTGFEWWIKRFKLLIQHVDVIRIDHFRGFEAFWQVPHGEKTAVNGTWAKCPGMAFFQKLQQDMGHLPVWAEDLGLLTHEVTDLRDTFSFPGMKVLQFAFGDSGAENPYLPINFESNFVCYTGTHDNDTVVGWWNSLTQKQQQQVLDYTGPVLEQDIHWAMIRLAMGSVADTVVVPLQDFLGLGTEARTNVPGQAKGNWSWRYEAGAITPDIAHKLRAMTTTFGRASNS